MYKQRCQIIIYEFEKMTSKQRIEFEELQALQLEPLRICLESPQISVRPLSQP